MHPLFKKADEISHIAIGAIGLLINFHELKLTDGLSRMILPGANQ
jgi:hypothetical protein